MDSHESAMVDIPNKRIANLDVDHLYHIGLDTNSYDLPKLFGDVKFVCMGGTVSRMKEIACFLVRELGLSPDGGDEPYNYAQKNDRYVVYKVGPVLVANHGIGIPSLSTIFHDVAKLLYHAHCTDVCFFRIGTCGGIDLPPGTVVISEKVLNGLLQPSWDLPILGKMVLQPAIVDKELAKNIKTLADNNFSFKAVLGTTFCANDFFEGQARVDGACCQFEDSERDAFLQELKSKGVTNIEMESVGFVALCHRLHMKGAVICVTLVDRFHEDQIPTDHCVLKDWQQRPIELVVKYIKDSIASAS